ncbi:hypothetical protein [Actinoplanes italicus]|uniref:hypothetical protein n=1 Tax=Actinoplanes italicus TaxID=113567 RepID=UPI001EF2CB59|nr:hypothetical protein [Actinoplanes italicus]
MARHKGVGLRPQRLQRAEAAVREKDRLAVAVDLRVEAGVADPQVTRLPTPPFSITDAAAA